MKFDMKNMSKVFIMVVLLAATGSVCAYPPDNAAVLYYRAFIIFSEPNEVLLRGVAKGEIAANESVRKYLDENRYALNCVEDATEIADCDWGLDMSEGFELLMSHLGKVRLAAYLLASDAKLLMQAGEYRPALEKSLVLHRMARHAGDEMPLSLLVGRAINNIANECIVSILGQMPDDPQTLAWLKSELVEAKQRVPACKRALAGELEILGCEIRKARYGSLVEDILNSGALSQEDIARIEHIRHADADGTFFVRCREYFTDYWTAVLTAYDLPYARSYEKLKSLKEGLAALAAESSEAALALTLAPNLVAIRSRDAESEALFNATIVSLDIYIVRARTGGLPDALAAGLPQDPFSDKDFLYEKTAEGFVLKCQGKDLDKDMAHEYKFMVK